MVNSSLGRQLVGGVRERQHAGAPGLFVVGWAEEGGRVCGGHLLVSTLRKPSLINFLLFLNPYEHHHRCLFLALPVNILHRVLWPIQSA